MVVDDWTRAGARITDEDVLARLRRIIENESAVIVEHRFYLGSRSPHRFISDDFDKLETYLRDNARPGDSFYVWQFEDCCREDNLAERGKIPDSEGKVPTGGSY